jgi:ATP-dependent helicase/nuclease subunit A
MTRAAQRLIVAGYQTSDRRSDGCWYDLVELGLRNWMTDAPAPWSAADTIRRFGEGLTADDCNEAMLPFVFAHLPTWLSTKPAPEQPPLKLTASRAGRPFDEERVVEGLLAHALLQMLPDIAPKDRAVAAKAYLAAHGAALGPTVRRTLTAQVVRVIEAPELAALFGRGSCGEVPLAGVLRRPGRAPLPYSGRLDRLLVTSDSVRIVDFKLGAAPTLPSSTHLAQLAVYHAALQPLYPTLPVRAALIYLEGPTIRAVADDALEAAIDAFLTP